MWNLLLLFTVTWGVLTFFYRQAVHEFRIHQADRERLESFNDLLHDQVPVVIRGFPLLTCWTVEDVKERECYKQLSVFRDHSLADWIQQDPSLRTICPWSNKEAAHIAHASGLVVWVKRWLLPMFTGLRAWYFPTYGCWSGHKGLHRLYAMWTCILPVDREIRVLIMPETMEPFLPPQWKGGFPGSWTRKDTPFVEDIKYLEIIVRPGTCLFLPPHWYVAWWSDLPAQVCTVSYDSLISKAYGWKCS